MKPRAVIFDMDGLLLDSERVYLRTFMEACQSLGLDIPDALFKRCIGTNGKRSRQILTEGCPGLPYDELMAQWKVRYTPEILERPLPVKAGARSLLTRLVDAGVPCVVATSTDRERAFLKLEKADLDHHFQFVVGGDEVSNGKPDPEIYRVAAERVGVIAHACLALEDSDNGVRAAHGAGIPVVQVPDLVAPAPDVLALGHVVVESLSQVEDSLFSDAP